MTFLQLLEAKGRPRKVPPEELYRHDDLGEMVQILIRDRGYRNQWISVDAHCNFTPGESAAWEGLIASIQEVRHNYGDLRGNPKTEVLVRYLEPIGFP